MKKLLWLKERKTMNKEQFEEFIRGNNLVSHDKVKVRCEECDIEFSMQVFKLRKKFKKYNKILCSQHSMSECWKDDDYKARVSEKVSKALKGVVRSEDTRQKMSEAKLAFYKTTEGEALKKKLSILTAKGHSENKFENTKRSGWYHSTKNNSLVFYGSSYELRLCWELDQDDEVESYETQINYVAEDRGRCLDCLVTYTDGSKMAIEVKPESRLTEQTNIDQIADSMDYAMSQGWKFDVCTELTFDMTCKELRDWADVLRTKLGDFDWVEFRKEQGRKKANKHYKNKIAKDKTTFCCEYCKEEHTVLTITRKKNIKKNDRFICHSENAHKPKPSKNKKINPYAAEGKKQCVKCKDVRLFEEFGLDKSRIDGYASRCKMCRRIIANEKYRDNYFKDI